MHVVVCSINLCKPARISRFGRALDKALMHSHIFSPKVRGEALMRTRLHLVHLVARVRICMLLESAAGANFIVLSGFIINNNLLLILKKSSESINSDAYPQLRSWVESI
jgi:hypothetical protein